jgi:hypothetical protein
MFDMISRNAISIPSQQMPVARAEGNSCRNVSLPARSSHIENHQKAVEPASAATPTRAGPATSLSQGCAHPASPAAATAAGQPQNLARRVLDSAPLDAEGPFVEFLDRSGGGNATKMKRPSTAR